MKSIDVIVSEIRKKKKERTKERKKEILSYTCLFGFADWIE